MLLSSVVSSPVFLEISTFSSSVHFLALPLRGSVDCCYQMLLLFYLGLSRKDSVCPQQAAYILWVQISIQFPDVFLLCWRSLSRLRQFVIYVAEHMAVIPVYISSLACSALH